MAILYTVIPANDARALHGVFPYSLGIILFLFGFYLLINLLLQKKYQYKNRALRGCYHNIYLFVHFKLLVGILFNPVKLYFDLKE